MQVIFDNKNKRRHSGRIDSVDIVLCVRGICRHMKEEYIGESRIRKFRI